MINRNNYLLFIGILVTIATMSGSAPLDTSAQVDGYSKVFVGNLMDDMFVEVLKNGVIAPAKRWPNATVRYKIARNFDDLQVASIKLAMSGIEAVSCVRFTEARKRTKTFVYIVPSVKNACNSMVGYRGRIQMLHLSQNISKCFKPVIIMHELLHTLGFYHEHMAPQRDDYITVNWENIIPGLEIFFTKLDNETVTDFGYGYDYDSVMHYGRKAFSVNRLDTMLPLDSNAVIGQRVGLSLKDIGKLNAMYNCTVENT